MNKYEVVSACYVPVGKGFRYRTLGQVVTLSDEQAAALADHIKLVDSSEGVAKRNTEPEVAEQPVEQLVEQPVEQPFEHSFEEVFGEVTPDAGHPYPGDE